MKLDIAAEIESSIASLPSASYLSMACVARSRPCLEETLEGSPDPYRRDTEAWLRELLARFQPDGNIGPGSEWLLEEPAPLRIARETGRGELRCVVYRSDTDLFIAVIGVFDVQSDEPQSGEPVREHGLEGRMRKIRSSYEFSFSYGNALDIESRDLTKALQGLDLGLEKYARVLAGLRGEYIHPLRTVSRGEVMHLTRSVDDVKKREEIRQKQDEFLDAYLDWKATHRIAERARLLELAKQLHELDPSFQFSSLE